MLKIIGADCQHIIPVKGELEALLSAAGLGTEGSISLSEDGSGEHEVGTPGFSLSHRKLKRAARAQPETTSVPGTMQKQHEVITERLRDQGAQRKHGRSTGKKAPSPSLSPQASFLIGLRLLTQEQRDQLWRYYALTDYGTRYVPPEKQAHVLQLLAQLAEEEKLYELEFFARLKQFHELKGQILRDGGPYLALFE